MKTVTLCKTGSVGILMLTLFTPMPTQADSWQWTPNFSLRTGIDDNVRLKDAMDDEAIESRAELQLDAVRLTETNEMRLFGRGALVEYSSADDETLDGSNAFLAGFRVRQQIGERSGIDVGLKFEKEDVGGTARIELNGLEPGAEQITPDHEQDIVSTQTDREKLIFRPKWRLDLSERSHVQIGYDYEDVSYDNNATNFLNDYEYQLLQGRYANSISERTTVSAKIAYADYEADQEGSLESTRLFAGWESKINERTRAWVNLGVSDTSITSGFNEEDETGFLGDANFELTSERSRFLIQLGRDLSPSGNGELLQTDSIALNYVHELSDRWELNVLARYFETQSIYDEFSTVEDREYLIFRPKLSYRMLERWAVSLTGRYRRTDSESRIETGESNAVFITLEYVPKKLEK